MKDFFSRILVKVAFENYDKNNTNNNFNSDNNNSGLSPRLMSELSYEEQMKLAVLMSSETT